MDFPHAEEVNQAIEQNIKETEKVFNEKNSLRIKKITECSEKYYQVIMKFCLEATTKLKSGKKHFIIINELSGRHIFDNIPSHILHYGHYDKSNNYYIRKKEFECERPFIRAQKELQKLGYYLLDETTPNNGLNMIIKLYTIKPLNYEYRKILWHSLNILPTN